MTRATKVLLALAAAHVLLKIALFPQVAHSGVFGDEAAYLDGGRALSNLVRDLASLGAPDGAELRRDVVGSGWFMPGMSALLTPLFLVVPHASMVVVHLYLGVLTTALFFVVVAQVRRDLGDRYAAALLVFPGLVPAWAVFGFAAYGDLCAGLLGLALLVGVVRLVRGVRAGVAPGWGDGVRLGLLAVAAVYLRSSATLVVVGAFGALLLTMLWLLRGAVRRRGVAVLALASAAFVAGLLPWSIAASSTLDARVVTTTSVPTVLANTFGDRDRICFGPCDEGSTIWFNPLRYSREVARATGRSEVDVQAEMSAYARRDVTPHSYSRDVLDNLRRYVQHPSDFATYLSTPGAKVPSDAAGYDSAGGLEGVVHTGVRLGTDLLFFPALAAGALALLVTFRRCPELQVISVLLKLGLGALLTQPFVHISGSRYWTTAAPLLGLALGMLWVWSGSRRAPTTAYAGERVLFVAQVILAAATAIIAVGVVSLSL